MNPKFLCDVVRYDNEYETSYDPAVMDYPVSFQALATTYDATAPGAWMLLETIGGDISVLSDDPRIDALPNVPNETLVSQIDKKQIQSLRAALARRQIGESIVDTAENFGAILAAIALRANSGNLVPTSVQMEL